MTSEAILEKLAKIKRHADSAKEIGNEAEAHAFATMLQNLLLKHKLEMTDIDYAKEMQSEPIIEHRPETVWESVGFTGHRRVYKDFPDVEVVEKRRMWAEDLANIITKAYSCRFLVSKGSSMIHFVGHKSNVLQCEYLYLTMLRCADKMSEREAKRQRAAWRQQNGGAGATPRGYRESWLLGFCKRLGERMEEERRKFETPSTSTALLRVNKEALEVAGYMGKFKTISSQRKMGQFNSEGYASGQKAANGLNLNRPLNSGDGRNRQLS
jgi:hypothetical protein